MDSIVSGLFNFLFNLINSFLSAIFSVPLTMVGQLFDGIVISDFTTNFYNILNTYVIPTASWFSNLIPPLTWNLIVLYFTFQLSLYVVVFATHLIVKPLSVIKKLVPFS